MPKELRKFRPVTAKRLRANTTGAEQKLWKALRRLPIQGSHFRRQVALGPYVVDFACQQAELVIEVDGSQHAEDIISRRDADRTRWLESEGYRVFRFWNSDVNRSLDGVLEKIHTVLQKVEVEASTAHPTPARSARRPSPSRGG